MNHNSIDASIEEGRKQHKLKNESEINNNYSLILAVKNGVNNSSRHEKKYSTGYGIFYPLNGSWAISESNSNTTKSGTYDGVSVLTFYRYGYPTILLGYDLSIFVIIACSISGMMIIVWSLDYRFFMKVKICHIWITSKRNIVKVIRKEDGIIFYDKSAREIDKHADTHYFGSNFMKLLLTSYAFTVTPFSQIMDK